MCLALFGLCLLAVSPTALAQDVPCSGHGTQIEGGKCQCDTPLPTDLGSGWVGEQCEQEVKRLPTDGSDTNVVLQPGAVQCWAATLGSPETPLHYFAISITLQADSKAGVELYGMLAADPNASPVEGQSPPVLYPTQAPGVGPWDYLASVLPESPTHEVLQLAGPEVTAVQQRGVFLCAVTAPAEGSPPASFTLRAAGHSCPLTLHDNGFISICSSTPEDVRYSSQVCPAGECECTGIYQKPNAPVDPGLGFETCSARVSAFDDACCADPVTLNVTGHEGLAWWFYNFTIGPTHKHLAVHVTATKATTSHLSVYLRPLQPPGRLPGEHVARTEWSDFSGDLSSAIQLGPGLPGPVLTQGLWYVGVYVFGDDPVDYSIALRRSACPGELADCSGAGTCDENAGVCTCAPEATGELDCSEGHRNLTLGAPVTLPPHRFHADEYVLEDLGPVLAVPTVSLQVKASFSSLSELPAWVRSRPVLLVSNQPPTQPPDEDHNQPGAIVLWEDLYEAGKEYTRVLNSAQVPLGKLWVYVWNPLSAPYQIGYTLSVEPLATCLDNCSGRGECRNDGRCYCQPGWLGATCNVDVTSLSNATVTCTPGSRLPIRRDEQHATCWAPCDPDTGQHDTGHCADFTCDPTNAEGQPQRRAGGQEACVTDLCGPSGANVTFTDPSGKFVCSRQCVCPEDGSLCALDPGCLPGTVRCLDGLVLRDGPDGTQQCMDPPGPGTCEEGSLRLAIAMEGGSGYGVCICQPATARRVTLANLRDGLHCAWTEPSPDDISKGGGAMPSSLGVVACAAGYQLHGAVDGGMTLTDGRKLTSGGRCVRIVPTRRGVSGGMVFFWCLFSVALFCTMVVGGRRAIEWYEARRWDVGDGDGPPGWMGYVRLGFDSLLNRGDRSSDNHW